MMSLFTSLTLFHISQISAQLIPTAPGPGQTFTAGSTCTIEWQPDTTGTWRSVAIDLMSGSNENMSLVTNVVPELDGTALSLYNWTCPEVDPYSAVYFYQFSQNGTNTNPSRAWTTRFTITSSNGASTSPEHTTQPNGDPIPWGIGQLFSSNAEVDSSSGRSSGVTMTTVPATNTSASVSQSTDPPPVSTATGFVPEVTLNIPVAKPKSRIRREGLATVYTRAEARSSELPRYQRDVLSTCKGRCKNARSRL